jgi:predicted amidophosphoribosyltransferase
MFVLAVFPREWNRLLQLCLMLIVAAFSVAITWRMTSLPVRPAKALEECAACGEMFDTTQNTGDRCPVCGSPIQNTIGRVNEV